MNAFVSSLGFDSNSLLMIVVVVLVVVSCAFIQRVFRRELERDQYYYLRDVSLIAAWAICGIWTVNQDRKSVV